MVLVAKILVPLIGAAVVVFAMLRRLRISIAFAVPTAIVLSQSILITASIYLYLLSQINGAALFGFAFDVLIPAALAIWVLRRSSRVAVWFLAIFEIAELVIIGLIVREAAAAGGRIAIGGLTVDMWPIFINAATRIVIVASLAPIAFGYVREPPGPNDARLPDVFD